MTNGGFHVTAREKYPCTTFEMTIGAGHHLNTLNVTRRVNTQKTCWRCCKMAASCHIRKETRRINK